MNFFHTASSRKLRVFVTTMVVFTTNMEQGRKHWSLCLPGYFLSLISLLHHQHRSPNLESFPFFSTTRCTSTKRYEWLKKYSWKKQFTNVFPKTEVEKFWFFLESLNIYIFSFFKVTSFAFIIIENINSPW